MDRWARALREIVNGSTDAAEVRIAYAMETLLSVVQSKPNEYRGYNPADDAIEEARLLRTERAGEG